MSHFLTVGAFSVIIKTDGSFAALPQMKRIVIIILSYVQDILPLHDPEAPDGQHRGHLFRIHTEKPSWGGVHEGHQTRSQKIISINSPATRSTRGINLPPKWINTNLELSNFTFISSPSQISCRECLLPPLMWSSCLLLLLSVSDWWGTLWSQLITEYTKYSASDNNIYTVTDIVCQVQDCRQWSCEVKEIFSLLSAVSVSFCVHGHGSQLC